MNRRRFLRTIAAGTVATLVPLPAPAKTFQVTGTITAYFQNTALYEHMMRGSELKKIWLDNELFGLNKQQDRGQQP